MICLAVAASVLVAVMILHRYVARRAVAAFIDTLMSDNAVDRFIAAVSEDTDLPTPRVSAPWLPPPSRRTAPSTTTSAKPFVKPTRTPPGPTASGRDAFCSPPY